MSVNNDTIKVTGALQVLVKNDLTGEQQVYDFKNLVVTAGKVFIAASMLKTTTNSPAAMTHMAIGTGTTAEVVGDTSLGAQAGNRSTFSTAASATSNVVTYVAAFPSGAGTITGAITEAGIFNAATAGTMLCRTTFAPINKTVNDSITITWNITIA